MDLAVLHVSRLVNRARDKVRKTMQDVIERKRKGMSFTTGVCLEYD